MTDDEYRNEFLPAIAKLFPKMDLNGDQLDSIRAYVMRATLSEATAGLREYHALNHKSGRNPVISDLLKCIRVKRQEKPLPSADDPQAAEKRITIRRYDFFEHLKRHGAEHRGTVQKFSMWQWIKHLETGAAQEQYDANRWADWLNKQGVAA